ncbi:ABC transporter permease subunit [Nonomuraea sediminis]|uniref:ABC transporter permease subunit n=1 Tax=Nonomuraea sediminis TaxID=2835864 RepID=UPI001BDC8F62|nr:ABC transporter permease subunit [Nonomuraea sediminis]
MTGRLRDLVAAEWIKLWSLRSTRWVIGLGVLVMIGISVQRAVDSYNAWPSFTPMEKAHFDPMTLALNGFGAVLLVIGAGSLGALAVVGEYASGLIRTTLIAVPARHRVVAAKVVVVAGVMLTVGALVAVATFEVSQAIMAGRGMGLSLGDPGVPRVIAANALLAPVSALVGMGLGALLRHTAGTVVAVCALLVVLPMSFKPNVHQWVNDLYGLFPFYVWRTCLSLTDPRDSPALPTVTGSWLVFALWPLAAALIALLAVRHRDV